MVITGAVLLVFMHILRLSFRSASPSAIAAIGSQLSPQLRKTGSIPPRFPALSSRSIDYSNIAVCMAVKDQAQDLPEFLRHHYYNIGVRHFYIMDDGSNRPLSSYLTTQDPDYYGIPSDALTFHHYTRGNWRRDHQMLLYDECVRLYALPAKHDWVGFLDVDEFVGVYPGNETLSSLLAPALDDFNIGAVALNWRIHTSGGHLHRQPSVRKAYTECVRDDYRAGGYDNTAVKSFVKPAFYDRALSPHRFKLLYDMVTVGELGDELTGPVRKKVTRTKMGVHHYAVKSLEEYQQKVHRGSGMDKNMPWTRWDPANLAKHQKCGEMSHYEV